MGAGVGRVEEFKTYDSGRNPIAAQLSKSARRSVAGQEARSIIGQPGEVALGRSEEMIVELWNQNELLRQAIAKLEDQLTSLRGAPASMQENLLGIDT